MFIDLRTRDIPLPRARAGAWQHHVRSVFRRIAHGVKRVVLEVAPGAGVRGQARLCTVEVHMADGHVERIEERQRRLGPLLRRAIDRAWEAAARRLAVPLRAAPPTRPAKPAALPLLPAGRTPGHD